MTFKRESLLWKDVDLSGRVTISFTFFFRSVGVDDGFSLSTTSQWFTSYKKIVHMLEPPIFLYVFIRSAFFFQFVHYSYVSLYSSKDDLHDTTKYLLNGKFKSELLTEIKQSST